MALGQEKEGYDCRDTALGILEMPRQIYTNIKLTAYHNGQ